jgi:CRISPR system Cascade subunit CasE
MFLSKLHVDVRSRTFRRDFANVHDMHRTLMSVYPDVPPTTQKRQAHGVLWRLDDDHSGFVQYVQSRTQPDWTQLPTGHLTAPPLVRSLEPLLAAMTPGRKLAFRLLANPTKCESKSRKRIPITNSTEQIAWLIRQGERYGFVIPSAADGRPDLAPTPTAALTGRKNDTGKITIEPVRYDGHLVVTDQALFSNALVEGIGRGKADGCGLISLAPPRSR